MGLKGLVGASKLLRMGNSITSSELTEVEGLVESDELVKGEDLVGAKVEAGTEALEEEGAVVEGLAWMSFLPPLVTPAEGSLNASTLTGNFAVLDLLQEEIHLASLVQVLLLLK